MDIGKKVIEIPEVLPVLPVRNTVLFPNAAVPLIVGRLKSIEAVKLAKRAGDLILVVSQKDSSKEEPAASDLYTIGVVCLISKMNEMEGGGYQLVANGLIRFEVAEYIDKVSHFEARGFQMAEVMPSQTTRVDALAEELRQLGKAILALTSIPAAESISKLLTQLTDAGQIADLCSTFLHLPLITKQTILETRDVDRRLQMLFEQMVAEKEKVTLQNEIQAKMMERLTKDQREHLLREQIKTLHEELGEEPQTPDDYTKKIEEAGLSPEAKKIAKEELARLNGISRSSPEYHVIRTYLDYMLALPWSKTSALATEAISLTNAKKILDHEHFGIEKVKKRIIQFLAVAKLKKDLKGPILCLVGPPGVGKTSIARAVSQALGRKFMRASLGGLRDEAEIRGHRRTYVGALPGRIIQSLKRVGVKDPVILLDEIDKVGIDFRGDPASALLEVLDPEQNNTFLDHYLDVPFDLSNVFFITTANVVETIPPALRDRMEIIEMTSYSKIEKIEIARRHILPKVITEHGLTSEQVRVADEALELVVDGYTRESGVRELSRKMADLCRFAAEQLAAEQPPLFVEIKSEMIEAILGSRRFYAEEIEKLPRPGVVTGLAWTPVGGEILKIEVTRMEGKGNLILTGQLGDVMKESAQIALSLIRANMGRLPYRFDSSDFHIHVPSGAIPKDGPSAGVALFLALTSLVEGRPVKPDLALTGEITLRGAVLPVGGIKEKVIAAHRVGIRTVILPERNQGDLRDVTDDVKKQLKFHLVKDISEILTIAGFEAPAEHPEFMSPSLPPSAATAHPSATN
ncbi:MAG: endopeptidase La [Deltaproteobacteria bacterium]|nr:endopeptidase La [Deltaproteobacteria bacterium]